MVFKGVFFFLIKLILKKFNMRRVIPVIVAFVVLVSSLVVPAFASATQILPPPFIVDYEEISEVYHQENGMDYISIQPPKSLQSISVRNENGQIARSVMTNGNPTLTVNLRGPEKGYKYSIIAGMRYLWTHNIPSGTEIEVSATIKVTGLNLEKTGTMYFSSSYVWDDLTYANYDYNVASEHTEIYEPPMTNRVIGQIWNINDGVAPGLMYRDFVPSAEGEVTIELEDLIYYIKIPTSYHESWINADAEKLQEKNNLLLSNQKNLLDNVAAQQQQTNEKLDDVIGGTPEQNDQVDSAVGGMHDSTDKLGDLNDSLNSVAKPDVDDIDVSINNLVPQTSLLAYTQPILAIWDNDNIKAMIVIVLTLVLISWVMFGKKG